MSKIFISYRHEDSKGYVGRLQQTLETRFRAKDIFVDLGDIAPGKDFAKVIGETVGHCEVLLVLMGPYWLTRPTGERRELSSDDYVRFEIVAALDRNIMVIPVLVGDAKLPTADQLPVDLQPLLTRQAITLTDVHWAADCKRLMDAIGTQVTSPVGQLRAACADIAMRSRAWLKAARLLTAKYVGAWTDPVVARVGKRRLIIALALIVGITTATVYVRQQNARKNALTTDMAREYLDVGSTATREGFLVRVANTSARSFCATINVGMEAAQGRTNFKSDEDFTQTWRAGSHEEFTVPYQTYTGELNLDRPLKVFTSVSVSALCD